MSAITRVPHVLRTHITRTVCIARMAGRAYTRRTHDPMTAITNSLRGLHINATVAIRPPELSPVEVQRSDAFYASAIQRRSDKSIKELRKVLKRDLQLFNNYFYDDYIRKLHTEHTQHMLTETLTNSPARLTPQHLTAIISGLNCACEQGKWLATPQSLTPTCLALIESVVHELTKNDKARLLFMGPDILRSVRTLCSHLNGSNNSIPDQVASIAALLAKL